MNNITIDELRKSGWIAFEYVRGSHAYGLNVIDKNGKDISDTDIGGVFICPKEMLYGLRSNYIEQIADEKGFIVQLFECGEQDHCHCFITAPPKLSVTTIVKYLKGITGRKLFERFPDIRQKLWKGELWNHSYYCETIGSVSEENIKRYIEHQSKSY